MKSSVSETQADSMAAEMEAEKKSFFDEFGEEDYGPLPLGWGRKRTKERKQPSDTTTFTSPLDIIPADSSVADTLKSPLFDEQAPTRPEKPHEVKPPVEEGDGGTDEEEDGQEATETASGSSQANMKTVDYTADLMRNLQITEDSTAVTMIGNVVFYHNGAVITCDSAVRFSEKRMEFYKRVVINNGTTYVYGDRAEYNGEMNLARVYSPIVKMVDQDAVLYTYNFSYNTLTERGRYWGGGIVTHNDNRMESLRGYYDTNTREFTGAGEVELTNPDYQMISDSVRYNLDSELAEFFTPTQIWNSKGEILLSDRGKYKSPSEDYEFTRNSYILTKTQEIWADSMEYFSAVDNTVMRRDIQIIDEENNAMAFGDYGEYWGETEYGFLTIEPSLLSFDPEQPDTLYMRSDSMFFYTYPYDQVFEGLANAVPEDTTHKFEERMERPLVLGEDGLPVEPAVNGDGSGDGEEDPEGVEESDNDRDPETSRHDEQAVDGSPPEEPPVVSRRQQKREIKTAKKAARTHSSERAQTETDEATGQTDADPADTETDNDLADHGTEIGDEAQTEENDGTEEEITVEEPVAVYESPYGDLIQRLHRLIAADSMELAMAPQEFWLEVKERIEGDSAVLDHYFYAVDDALTSGEIDTEITAVPTGGLESIVETILAESQLIAASVPERRTQDAEEPADSVQRVLYGYYNVRIFRDDFQAVCDSIVGFSKDSTLHMHIDPVLWSDQNQVVSDVIIMFTKDEQLYKAEYYGSPFMSQQVDSVENQYNQIKGRFMTSWFRDNDIYRHDVQGNAQTYYYMQDERTKEVQNFMVCESSDVTFFIEEKQIEDIIYRGEPDWVIYPMDMLTPDIDQKLPGFSWQEDRRPRSKEEVHTRFIRERQREAVLAVPMPEFPLTQRMEQRKEELTRQNMWRDRNDTLSPHALEFVREMELKYSEEGL